MAVLPGCSEEAPGREDGPLAGTIVNPATPVEQCQLLLKEDWAVGELDGPEAATFGNIIACRVAADGTVLIVDNLHRNVRIVDAAGVVRGTVGRQGDGPGEFGFPYRVAVNDSHFVVYDIGLNRFVRFDRNGRHLATAVAPFAMSGNMHIALAPNGHTYAGGRDAGIDAQIHELDQDFRLIRSFGALPGHADPGDAELLSWGALVADATGLWFSRAAAYSIQRYDLRTATSGTSFEMCRMAESSWTCSLRPANSCTAVSGPSTARPARSIHTAGSTGSVGTAGTRSSSD